MSPVSRDPHLKNQLASEWMHRGMDLATSPSLERLEQAVRCFDEAIALRQTLPLDQNHFFRYGLSAGWINRGDVLARMGGKGFPDMAIRSYDKALVLLESLPLEENALYPRRLAITWINRGVALQKQGTFNALWEAVECFREAIDVLEHPSALAIIDRPSLLGGAWANLAGVWMDLEEEPGESIQSAARQALMLVQCSEYTDAASAQIGLQARKVLCRFVTKNILCKKSLPKEMVAEATDAVDESMAMARHWEMDGKPEFAKLLREIFRFGCRIYENSLPHFLAEFLMESLTPEALGQALLSDQETFDAAQAAIWSVLGKFQLDGFRSISTSHFEPFLSDIQELQQAEKRLEQLRPGPGVGV